MLLVYDGTCSLCQNFVAWFRARDTQKRVEFLACQDPKRQTLAPTLTEKECMSAMQLVLPGGKVKAGYDAVPFLFRVLPQWQWRAAGVMLALPGMTLIGRPAYRCIASNRYRIKCDNGTCHV